MPSQARIISPKNSAEWDNLVAKIIDGGLGIERTYAGCPSEERANHARMKIRTAARKQEVASKVFYRPCDAKPGKCPADPECTHHVMVTLYEMNAGREYKAKQSQRR